MSPSERSSHDPHPTAARHRPTYAVSSHARSIHNPRPALFTRHPARSILDAKLFACNLRSVCARFRDALPPPQGVKMHNVAASHPNIPRRDNPHGVRSGTNMWLPEPIMLHADRPTIFAYEVRADNSQSECIGAFSHSCARWQGGSAGEECAPNAAPSSWRIVSIGARASTRVARTGRGRGKRSVGFPTQLNLLIEHCLTERALPK